jgi:hypothetical protein
VELVADALLAAYGPGVGVVAFAAYGAVRVLRLAVPHAPAWALRGLAMGVGALAGWATWRTGEGAVVGAAAGAAASAVVATVKARAKAVRGES